MNWRIAYARVMPYICIMLAIAATIFYVGYAIEENNKKTCRLYEIIYQPSPTAPIPDPNDPTQERASEIRKEVGKLVSEFNCREKE